MSLSDADAPSETSTLLPKDVHDATDDARGDKPVELDRFQRNVARCKVVLGALLPLSVGLDIRHVALFGGGPAIAALVLSAIVSTLYAVTILRPLRFPHLSNLGLHRAFCQNAFFALIAAILLRWSPWLIHVWTHKRADGWKGGMSAYDYARIVIGVLASFAVGAMRRGPLLRYTPPRLSTGFGISGAMFNVGIEEGKANVLDWNGSSMLGYMTLSYNSAVAIRSTQVEQLEPFHLPFLEEKVRLAGVDKNLATTVSAGPYTAWTVIKDMFWPRRWIIVQCFLIETVGMLFSFLQIAAMHELIDTFNDKSTDRSYAYLVCLALFVGEAMETVLSAISNVKENYQLNEPTRMVFFTMLFRKILRTRDVKGMDSHHLSEEEREQNKGQSQILNLLTSDSFTVSVAGKRVWELTNALLALTIGGGFLYSMMGISAVVGVLTIPLAAPISYFVAKSIYHCDKVWMRSRDARVSAMKEFIECIKVIKLNGWEPHFKRRIERLRDVEIVWQRWRYHLGTMFNIMADQLPVLSLAIMFTFHTLVMKRQLDPATGFVTFTVFNRVKDALGNIPGVIQALLSTRVSLGRLLDFLNQDETDHLTETASRRIVFDEATVTWPGIDVKTENTAFRLQVNMAVPDGITLVCGPLGSGKTLFLLAVLGEALTTEGKVHAPRSHPDDLIPGGPWINDSIAYAPQQSYIRHGSIRENILFGQEMREDRYRQVLKQCGLLPDLEVLPEGDMTEVGDKGVTLSGGQKARVNLARCIYSRARTVLLDDILSAVDAHTAQHIVTQCLNGSLVQGRNIVLVTHQVGLCLPSANFVITLRNGKVEQACRARDAMIAPDLFETPDSPSVTQETAAGPALSSREVYTREHRAVGRVAMGHYTLVLAAAGGYAYWTIMIVLVVGFRLAEIARQKTLADWTDQPDNSQIKFYLGAFLGITLLSNLLGAVRWVWLYGVRRIGMYNRGCRVIHKMLFDRLANAPLEFFDSTPKGRLLNVIGQDIFTIDSQTADNVGRGMFQLTGTVSAAIMVVLYEPRLLIVILVMSVPFHFLNKILRKLRADIRRVTSICYSPLASLFSDTIDGVVMIRAFGLGRIVSETLITLTDQEKKAWVANWFVFQWARLVIQSLSAVVISSTGFLLVDNDWTAAQAGFILSFALMISSGLFALLERASELEQTFVSAERVNYYIQLEKQETTEGDTPPASWPEHGGISIRNLRVKYAPDLPDVLHGLSLNVEAGTRLGLVGATGSGKSTLALSLFRGNLQSGGSIEIDGIDIGRLALPELRGRLNMIVQESTLCSGTLRDALDISGECDDYEIHAALRQVHLGHAPFDDLESFVAVEGANFSQGERQLLCLARALLKRSKILVMDEVAAMTLTGRTDAKITETINECFAGTTMIVIAHRLATIMHFDAVAVLDAGVIVEQGKPADLIKDSTSRFHGMCMAQGPEEFERLRRLVA